MIATHAKAFFAASAERDSTLQLFICHCLIFTVAIACGAPALPILGICLLSFLLLLNIPYRLHQIERALGQLVQGQLVEQASLNKHWPLTHIFEHIDTLAQQMRQQRQAKQSNLAYRDQLFQQVGKAAAQEERNRLARDLHDSIKQQIFSIAVSAAAIRVRWEHDRGSIHKIVDDIERVALEAQVEMQALLQQLRPVALENVGLIESLRMQCQALGYRTGANVSAELSELPDDELLPLGAPEMIFRIVQEAFSNIARHARATHIWLSLRRQRDALLVEIGDDGQGFDLTQAIRPFTTYGGMGLSNVEERIRSLGGTISIWSQPGKGTTLHLCIPITSSPLEARVQDAKTLSFGSLNKSQRILRNGVLAVQLAAVFILLYMPAEIALWVTGAGTLIALSQLLWFQRDKTRRQMEIEQEKSQYFLLLADSYKLLSGILLLGLLWPGYLVSLHFFANFTTTLNTLWPAISLPGIFGLGLIASASCYFREREHYLKALPLQEVSKSLRQQRQQLIIDWLAWGVGASLTLFLPMIFTDISQDPLVHTMGIVLLSIWCIGLLLHSLQTVHNQRTQRRSPEITLYSQKDDHV